jgi:hypothetical protein
MGNEGGIGALAIYTLALSFIANGSYGHLLIF